MKKIILGLVFAATVMTACNNNKSTASKTASHNMQEMAQTDSVTLSKSAAPEANAVSLKEIVSSYLTMKNALSEDNSTATAKAGEILQTTFKSFDKSALTTDQKKIFEDVETDAIENAEHIAENGGNIAHQREHFELLSKDIYDLVKTFGAGQVLYKVYDSMFNSGKGAFWLSETKEIKNPYMGKAMLTSGSIKEEIK